MFEDAKKKKKRKSKRGYQTIHGKPRGHMVTPPGDVGTPASQLGVYQSPLVGMMGAGAARGFVATSYEGDIIKDESDKEE